MSESRRSFLKKLGIGAAAAVAAPVVVSAALEEPAGGKAPSSEDFPGGGENGQVLKQRLTAQSPSVSGGFYWE